MNFKSSFLQGNILLRVVESFINFYKVAIFCHCHCMNIPFKNSFKEFQIFWFVKQLGDFLLIPSESFHDINYITHKKERVYNTVEISH